MENLNCEKIVLKFPLIEEIEGADMPTGGKANNMCGWGGRDYRLETCTLKLTNKSAILQYKKFDIPTGKNMRAELLHIVKIGVKEANEFLLENGITANFGELV